MMVNRLRRFSLRVSTSKRTTEELSEGTDERATCATSRLLYADEPLEELGEEV
jgi:hypothetical protein